MKLKRNKINEFKCVIPAKSINESFSRMLCSAFVSQCDPTIEELSDIKTSVSEAVTNCIVHAYHDYPEDKKKIYILCESYSDGLVIIKIKDKGCGIENIEKAMEPLYTGSKSQERSGMGFSIMQSFMDTLTVKSKIGKGTSITMKKLIGKESFK